MKYIDLMTGHHSKEEHYAAVHNLLKQGYTFIYNTFGNPYFHHYEDRTKEDVCILASIVDTSGYFRI